MVAPLIVCATTFTLEPVTTVHVPPSTVYNCSDDSATPAGIVAGSYLIVIVTGALKVVPLGPNSNADPATKPGVAGGADAGVTVTTVLAASAPAE